MSELLGSVFFADGNYLDGNEFPAYESLLEKNASVYEVIRVEDQVPLFLEDYLDRLTNSFRLLGKPLPHGETYIRDVIQHLVKVNTQDSVPVKLVFGLNDPAFFFAFLMKANIPQPKEYVCGVKTILLEESRSNPNLKVWNKDLRKRSIDLLAKEGAYEAILVNPDGAITEASRSNIFFIKNNQVYTTPVELVLPGITRKKVIEVCRSSGIEVVYKQIHRHELDMYDACFLTGTARKVVPICCIDEVHYKTDTGIMHQISAEFEKFVNEYLADRS